MTIFWVDDSGKMVRATDDSQDLSPLNPVTTAPESGKQVWDSVTETWSAVPIYNPLITTEELYTALQAKGLLVDSDRPRPKNA